MIQKRTTDERDRQIEGLRAERRRLPEMSLLGNKNWERIDAQIAVLFGTYMPEVFWEPEGENLIFSEAEKALMWLDGVYEEDLFS